MQVQDALGGPGAPRSVYHVRRMERMDGDFGVLRRAGGDFLPLRVHCDCPDAIIRKPAREAAARQDDADSRVPEHVAHALVREGRVEGRIRRAGLERPHDGRDHVRAGVHADANHGFRTGPQPDEVMRGAIGLFVERGIGKNLRAVDDGGPVGLPLRPVLEDAMNAGVFRFPRFAGAPTGEDLSLLVRRQRPDFPELFVRRGDSVLHDRLQARDQPVDGFGGEKVRAVLDNAVEVVFPLREGKRKLEFGRSRGHSIGFDQGGAEPGGGFRRVLQGEHHLEEGRAAEFPSGTYRVHHFLEGNVLVGESVENDGLDDIHQAVERNVVGRLDAEREGVHKKADEPFELGAAPVRGGGPDEEVLLPGPFP